MDNLLFLLLVREVAILYVVHDEHHIRHADSAIVVDVSRFCSIFNAENYVGNECRIVHINL